MIGGGFTISVCAVVGESVAGANVGVAVGGETAAVGVSVAGAAVRLKVRDTVGVAVLGAAVGSEVGDLDGALDGTPEADGVSLEILDGTLE